MAFIPSIPVGIVAFDISYFVVTAVNIGIGLGLGLGIGLVAFNLAHSVFEIGSVDPEKYSLVLASTAYN